MNYCICSCSSDSAMLMATNQNRYVASIALNFLENAKREHDQKETWNVVKSSPSCLSYYTASTCNKQESHTWGGSRQNHVIATKHSHLPRDATPVHNVAFLMNTLRKKKSIYLPVGSGKPKLVVPPVTSFVYGGVLEASVSAKWSYAWWEP